MNKNKYCKIINLHNESDVEQNFLIRLLDDLGFTEDYRRTKTSIVSEKIGKGKKRHDYTPDYICYTDKEQKKPVLIIDAKNPKVSAEEGIEDAQLYASILRRKIPEPKPDQICIGSNAINTIIKKFDSDMPILELIFDDFVDENPKFTLVKQELNRIELSKNQKNAITSEKWCPKKPSVDEIKGLFQKCHKLIWKRQSQLPTKAFYEFTKLIFLKMNEDKRLHAILDSGENVYLKDVHFHTNWIDEHSEISPNPINSILFQELNRNLEDLVRKNKKKQIFKRDEIIDLLPSTIRGVVYLLQDYDLFGIDEDLNGRMFEVFLSAAVRGKNLGAYFTPRSVVELMVNMIKPSITRNGSNFKIETVLDGCCGSGGFLIDTMAYQLDNIRKTPSLISNKDKLISELYLNSLFGIDSNPDIAKIARINMYLHGDGGSRIYCADCLDKEMEIEEGEEATSREERNELKELFIGKQMKFDVILTNPPFATQYSEKDKHEERILGQYLITKEGTPKKSMKSNVLFLARYHDLLKPNGRMMIVLDNSLLNSQNFFEYREWLRENFIIRAIISLPKYSFIQAGAGGVTSILYLERKNTANQEQPPIFARKVTYTGISKSGKEIKENDLPDVFKEWDIFERTGKLYINGKEIGEYDNDDLFIIKPEMIDDRIDIAFYSPSYRKMMGEIENNADGNYEVKKLENLNVIKKIIKSDELGKIFKYIDIGAIDLERGRIILSECQEGILEDLPDRARIKVKENDVVFPLSYDSFGKVAIISTELDGQLVSSGFMAIRCNTFDEAILLWAIIRSDAMQKQFDHVASGYTQREISKDHLSKYIKFLFPLRSENIIKRLKENYDKAQDAREIELKSLNKIDYIINDSIGPL